MKACPVCRQYCADQKTVCPKCGGSLESASDFHRAHPEQHTEAIDQLLTALARDPGDTATRRRLIDLYQAQGNWPQVAAHLRVLADADPHDTALQAALVDVLGLAGRGAEAALVLRGLLVKHPDDQGLRQKLDDILAWLPLDGLEAAHQAPLAQLWVEAGDAKREAGDLDAAADLYLKAHGADEGSGAARRLAEVYAEWATQWERQGRHDQALSALDEALALAPGDAALGAQRSAMLNRRKRRRNLATAAWVTGLLLLTGLCIYLHTHRPIHSKLLSAQSPVTPSPTVSTPTPPAAPAHRVTLEVSDEDHLAVAQLNGVSVLPQRKSSFEGSEEERTTEPSAPVDLTGRMKPGANEFHFQVRNSGEGGFVRSRVTVRVDDTVVYQKGIEKQDAAEGIKFEDRFTLTWPPTEPTKIAQQSSTNTDPFFSAGSNGKPSSRPSSERGASRQVAFKDGKINESVTIGRLVGSTEGNNSTYFLLAIQHIEKAFKPPQTRPDATCELSFVIGRTGVVRDIIVKRSTGTPEWDQWAIDAVKQATLPPLYDNIKADAIPVTITFDYGP